jgi:hypothetical protein
MIGGLMPTPSLRHRSPFVRGVLVAASLLTAWHVFASFLWIAPVTPLRELVPGNLLTSYMIPWYGQSWSVFAPEPINGDYRFKVRALVSDGGDATHETEWIVASDVEMSLSRHNLFPPRASALATHQASLLKGAYDRLSTEQRATAALNYFEGDDWLGRMQLAMNKQGTDDATVVSYIVQERYSDAYATQVARAMWGDRVIRVQYQVLRQNIIPFAERNDPDAIRPPEQIADTGWRGLIVMPDQSPEDFADTFRSAAERLEK